jgi:hypothetical protein
MNLAIIRALPQKTFLGRKVALIRSFPYKNEAKALFLTVENAFQFDIGEH